MPVKYAPAHTSRVGASTKGNTVDELHVSRRPFGTGDILTAAHSLGREGGKEDTKKGRG